MTTYPGGLLRSGWVCKDSTPLAKQNIQEKESACMVKGRGESKLAWKESKQKITIIWMSWALMQASCAQQMAEWLNAVGSLDLMGRSFRWKTGGFLFLFPENFALKQ